MTADELREALEAVPGDWEIEVANGHILVAGADGDFPGITLGEV